MTKRTGKSFRTKSDYNAKDLKRMKKAFVLFTVFFPIFLILSALETRFSFGKSFRIGLLEFCVEWWQVTKLIFGGKTYDYSIEFAEMNFKQRVKREKVDMDVAMAVVGIFGRHHLWFGSSRTSINFSYEDHRLEVEQLGKDNFKVYYNNGKWNGFEICSEYQLTKEQTITAIKSFSRR